jgi:hypothetical protein
MGFDPARDLLRGGRARRSAALRQAAEGQDD